MSWHPARALRYTESTSQKLISLQYPVYVYTLFWSLFYLFNGLTPTVYFIWLYFMLFLFKFYLTFYSFISANSFWGGFVFKSTKQIKLFLLLILFLNLSPCLSLVQPVCLCFLHFAPLWLLSLSRSVSDACEFHNLRHSLVFLKSGI